MLQSDHPLYRRLTMHNNTFAELLERVEKALDLTDDRATSIGDAWSQRALDLAMSISRSLDLEEHELVHMEARLHAAVVQFMADVERLESCQSGRFVGACIDFVLGGILASPEA